MYSYPICSVADKHVFEKQCAALEKNIPKLKKAKRLIDVDDGIYQHYLLDGKAIVVLNSECRQEVRIDSEVELTQFFK